MFFFGEHLRAYDFLTRYPEVAWELLLYSIASPIANYFVFLMVTEFGSLQCSIVTTSRKFLTILVNTLGYHRHLSDVQIYSIAGVFAGLCLEQYGSYREKEEKKEKAKAATKKEL